MKIKKSSSAALTLYISGGWGYGNRGDNAILQSTLMSLREAYSDAQIILSSFDADEIKRHHGLDTVPSSHAIFAPRSFRGLLNRISYRLWRKFGRRILLTKDLNALTNELRKADLLIMAGGGYFAEGWTSMATAQFALIFLADSIGLPVVSIGQSIGPFTLPKFRREMEAAVEKVQFFACRDEDSLKGLRSLGLSEPAAILTADTANLLIPHEPATKPIGETRIRLGVMVQHFRKHFSIKGKSNRGKIESRDAYEKLVLEVLLRCHSLFSIDFVVIPSTTWDAALCLKMAQQLSDAGASVEYVSNPLVPEYISACQSVDVMFSTNMHPLILAAAAGIPSIALSYNFKTDRFMNSIGLDEYCFRIDDFSVNELSDSIASMISNVGTLSETVQLNHRHVREAAQQNIAQIVKLFTIG